MSEITDKMKTYTGTKTLKATPMTKLEYNRYRGWPMPDTEDPNEPIYLVEYAVEEDTKPNHPDHEGYISMSPKTVFEKYYRPADNFADRLRIEGDELSLKIVKLQNALTMNTVPEAEVDILGIQLSAMTTYLNVLSMRIVKLDNV